MRISNISIAVAMFVLLATANIAIAQPAESRAGQSENCSSVSLQNLCSTDFDNVYMLTAYQQNADIAALAKHGSSFESCMGLHELTDKIVHERNDLNAKLSVYYSQFTGCCIPAGNSQIGSNCYANGCEYANALITKLEQSKAAADLAIARSCRPELQYQAKIVSRASLNEALALRRWQRTGRTAYSTQWEPLSEYCGVTVPGQCDACEMFTP